MICAGGPLGRRAFLRSAAATVACAGLGMAPAYARPRRKVLALAYSGPFGRQRGIQNLQANLAGAEFEDAWYWGRSRGDLARLLAQNTYDQLWLWDHEIGLAGVDEADVLALADWFDLHPNIVLDSRSSGVRLNDQPAEIRFAQNIRDALDAEGGGLWIGAGAAPSLAMTGNACLAALESGPFAGPYEDEGELWGDIAHPLLAGINVQGLRFREVRAFPRSAAPTIGPGGMALHTVVRDHRANPLITTSIAGPNGFLRTDPRKWFAARPPERSPGPSYRPAAALQNPPTGL